MSVAGLRERKREQERHKEEDEGLFTYRVITASRYIDIDEPTTSRELPKIFLSGQRAIYRDIGEPTESKEFPKSFHQDGKPFIKMSANQ